MPLTGAANDALPLLSPAICCSTVVFLSALSSGFVFRSFCQVARAPAASCFPRQPAELNASPSVTTLWHYRRQGLAEQGATSHQIVTQITHGELRPTHRRLYFGRPSLSCGYAMRGLTRVELSFHVAEPLVMGKGGCSGSSQRITVRGSCGN